MNPRTWHSHVYRVVGGALRAISMGVTGDARFCIRKITLRVSFCTYYISSAPPRLSVPPFPLLSVLSSSSRIVLPVKKPCVLDLPLD